MMDDVLILRSGNQIYANDLILGISPDLSIFDGYDGRHTRMPDDSREKPDWGDLSPDDVRELADIAIDRWTRLKEILNGV